MQKNINVWGKWITILQWNTDKKKIKIIKNLEIDLAVQEEKNCILQMNYDSLLQKINDVKNELELIIKLCPECNNISWTIDDLIKIGYYIKFKESYC